MSDEVINIIDIIDELVKDLSDSTNEAICADNAKKYILRWKKTKDIQDIRKAIWYLHAAFCC